MPAAAQVMPGTVLTPGRAPIPVSTTSATMSIRLAITVPSPASAFTPDVTCVSVLPKLLVINIP